MMTNIILNNQREEFLNRVNEFLSFIQFTKHNDSFERNMTIYGPSHRIIINGHIMDREGPSCPVKFIVEHMGQCELLDNGHKFDIFHFSVHADCKFQQDYKYVCGISCGFYYDELSKFKQFTLNAFKLL